MGRPRKVVEENSEVSSEVSAEDRALEILVSSISKEFGDGAVFRVTDENIQGVSFSGSGSIKLDKVLGRGYAEGRIVEVFGPESSGKTSLLLHAIAVVQKSGKRAAFIDAEHALDVKYAQSLGVDVENLLISQPNTAEQALEITDALVRSGLFGIIGIDSVAALVPKAELDGEMGDSHVGLQARLMSQAMRKLASITYRTGTILVFLNQLRMKIGVMFGNPEVTSGGNALKFYASQRLDVRRVGQNKDASSGEVLSNQVRVKCVKNKVAPPYRECELDLEFGHGVVLEAEIIDLGVELNIIEKSGSWYSYKNERLGQGRNQCIELLRKNIELREELLELVKAQYLGV